MSRYDAIDERVRAMADADSASRERIRDELIALARAFPDPGPVISHLEQAKRGIPSLEARWEVDEVIEAITPPPEPVEEEPEEAAPTGPLRAEDLELVYDDPRGIRLFKTKVGERWVLSQVDPRTMQSQSQELHPSEVDHLRMQLMGSPYWVKGA